MVFRLDSRWSAVWSPADGGILCTVKETLSMSLLTCSIKAVNKVRGRRIDSESGQQYKNLSALGICWGTPSVRSENEAAGPRKSVQLYDMVGVYDMFERHINKGASIQN